MAMTTSDVIGALESAKSFYQYRLDAEAFSASEETLFREEIETINQIIANERVKIAAVERLLQLCESSLELLQAGFKDKLAAAMTEVRTSFEHIPVLPDVKEGSGRIIN